MSTETIDERTQTEKRPIRCAIPEYGIEIPMEIRNLADFREWVHSGEFPERGRIDFIGDRIEVDMSPEKLSSHGSPKVEIVRVFANRNKEEKLGEVYVDRGRLSSPTAELSAEPDVMFVSYDSLKSGLARKIPSAKDPEDFIEIEGAVDLVVEVVSDSSVTKDLKRLPAAYHEAGVREFWLIDARGTDLMFAIHHRGKVEFEPAVPDQDGFQISNIFNRRYRLDRKPHPLSDWLYDLQEAEIEPK